MAIAVRRPHEKSISRTISAGASGTIRPSRRSAAPCGSASIIVLRVPGL
jgi:hypothetical protein